MKITAAICTYNREKYLPKVLDSILSQTLSKNEFEIIVVDNNSPGNTKEIIEDFKITNPDLSLCYFLETNQGLSFARNRCIQESQNELITFIDDDAFLDENYLKIVVSNFESDSRILSVGGKILLHYESIIPKWENKYLNSLLGYYSPKEESFIYPTTGGKLDYPRGSNMAFRKKIFGEIGGFDVHLGRQGKSLLGGEEKDIYYRLFKVKNAKVIYCPEAIIFHCVPEFRTTKEFIIKQAIGTGQSEYSRLKSKGKMSLLNGYFSELIKWLGSIYLYVYYSLSHQKEKGKMILVFRKYVSIGLFKGV